MTYRPERIDGAVEWAKLSPDVQSTIGGAAIELVAAWLGRDAAPGNQGEPATAETRAFEAADGCCSDWLIEAISPHVPAIHADQPPLPASLGDVCRLCGCSHYDPCDEGCSWQSHNLCSACRAEPEATASPDDL